MGCHLPNAFIFNFQVLCDCDMITDMDSPQSQLTTPDNLLFSHNIVTGVIFPPFINQKHVDEFSFSYSLITKSQYGLLKGVLVLVIVN